MISGSTFTVSVTTGTDLSLTLEQLGIHGFRELVSVTTGTDLSLTPKAITHVHRIILFQLPPELIYH